MSNNKMKFFGSTIFIALLLLVSVYTPLYAEEKAEEKKPEGGAHGGAKPGEGGGSKVVFGKSIAGEVPGTDPMSSLWDQAPEVEVKTSPQVMTEPRVFDVRAKTIKIRALHNGKDIAIRMEFDDPVEEVGDGAALEFMVGDLKAHFAHGVPMGQVEGGPVNMWHWKKEAGGEVVRDLSAKGYSFPPDVQLKQNVKGKGVWQGGKWRVVFTRPMNDGDEQDVQFTPAVFNNMAMATWDTGNNETGARHALTSWYWVITEAQTGNKVYVNALLGILIAAAIEAIIISKINKSKS